MEEMAECVDTNPDRITLNKLSSEFPAGGSLLPRTYGKLRRAGKSPAEASDDLVGLINGPAYESVPKGEVAIDHERQKRLAESLGYQWELEHPEDYLYHGTDKNSAKSVVDTGLMKGPQQSQAELSEIFFFEGTQPLHQSADDGEFHGFGYGGSKFRVKRSILEELGFKTSETPFGDDVMITAARVNPVVPPEDLEMWDEEVRMWLPVVSADKSLGDSKPFA